MIDSIGLNEIFEAFGELDYPNFLWLKVEGTYQYTSKYAQEIAGRDIVGLQDKDFIPSKEVQIYQYEDELVINTRRKISSISSVLLHKDEYVIKTEKIPIIKNNEVIGLLGFARDISIEKDILCQKNKLYLNYSMLNKSIDSLISGSLDLTEDQTHAYVSLKRRLFDLSFHGTEKKPLRFLLAKELGIQKLNVKVTLQNSTPNLKIPTELYHLTLSIIYYFRFKGIRFSFKYSEQQDINFFLENSNVIAFSFLSGKKVELPILYNKLSAALGYEIFSEKINQEYKFTIKRILSL